jgi:hypothetical protein
MSSAAESFMIGFNERLNLELKEAEEKQETVECYLFSPQKSVLVNKVRAVVPDALRITGFIDKQPVTLLVHVATVQFAFFRFPKKQEG